MLKLKNIISYIKKHKLILMYLLISSFILYALLTATLNTDNMMNLIFSILFIALVVLVFLLLIKTKKIKV